MSVGEFGQELERRHARLEALGGRVRARPAAPPAATARATRRKSASGVSTTAPASSRSR